MDDLVNKLLNYSISPYELMVYSKKNSNLLNPIMKTLVAKHKSPYIRLCAAWSLGEMANKGSFDILNKAYETEKEVNVKANIVWALFRVDPEKISKDLFEKFLLDEYYVIPLIALKRIQGLYWLEGKYDFSKFYNRSNNILVRLELLRNIRSFKYPSNINNKLKEILYMNDNLLIKLGSLKAIGATNQHNSIDILMDYYSKFKKEILSSEPLTFYLTSAILLLSQSKPYNILREIYEESDSKLIRFKVIEALVSVGGPQCLGVLKYIFTIENDEILKREIGVFINSVKITTNDNRL